MHLKKLSLYGFKSFAGRVDLDLAPGVVGIVGPNGVGKSNISDALRWALGEQSPRILRGSRMQDVIFSGSSQRRSLGYAEVVLVFDNSDGFLNVDYSEVTVARRVHRSGESEYLLNGVQCRLRDIQDLFSGTGLGREAYSVVEQGKIDAILSARPEDRRSVFDEAAGIMKYRMRKRDAERKLVEVRADQLRVGDLTAELGRQLPVLRTQAEEAIAWRELTSKLAESEQALLCSDLKRIDAARSELSAKIASLDDQANAAAAKLAESEAALEMARIALAEAEGRVDSLHVAVGEARAAAERSMGKHGVVLERHAGAQARVKAMESDLVSADEQLKAARADYDTVSADTKASRAVLAEAEEAMDHARMALFGATDAREKCESELDSSKTRLFDVLARGAELRTEQSSHEASARSGLARATRLNQQIEHKRLEIDALDAALHQAVAEMESSEKGRDHSLIQQTQALALAENASRRLEQLDNDLRQCKAKVATLQAAHGSLQGLQRDYEGYGRAVRALLSGDTWKRRGLIGVVAELIKSPADYEAAIESALGGALQNIITVTADVAELAVAELKRLKAGRATFLPLDILRPQSVSPNEIPRGKPGVCGIASELVEFDPAYAKVVQYLLGRVLVVNDLASGTALVRSGCRLRIATLDGDLISAAGAITGGERNDRQSGLMSRVRRLEEMGRDLEQAQALAREVTEAQKEAQAELTQANATVQAASADTAQAHLAHQQAVQALEAVRSNIAAARDALEALVLEDESLKADGASAAQSAQMRAERMAELNAEKELLEKSVADLASRILCLREAESATAIAHSEASAKLAAAKERAASADAERLRRSRELAGLSGRVESLRAEAERTRQELIVLQQQIDEAESESANAAAEHSTAQAELDKAMVARSEASEVVAVADKAARAARRMEVSIGEKLREASVAEARKAAECEGLAQRLWDEYGIGAEDALALPTAELNRSDTVTQVEQLRAQLESLGPVNHTAPEESAALAERYDFLSKQLTDLESAQNSLFGVVRECDRICTIQFLDTFEELRGEFADMFTEIFGGGTADLVLEDPSNPLECGVEIVCQPPGKRLASLSLLSGGEKSLVAIALLFAIMRVKPSPVCVLDEIDAALDEANVARFVEILKSISSRVQVLIVTHRKRTMECADTLFGVTMEEQGVSKVLSLRAPSYQQ